MRCARGRGAAMLLAFWLCAGFAPARAFPEPQIPWEPRGYVCARATGELRIDGRIEESDWAAAPWTGPFLDISGPQLPAPRFATRAKMLWDDHCFYVCAEMEEPDLWATLTDRDAVIYRDNDFEVFIDPDGDTHAYYELELNALNTVWDLLLLRPYRDGGPAVNAWDIAGLRTAVHLEGTLNQPGDTDRGWSVEIAFPWAVLRECAGRESPPREGDRWRVNFSRVEWRTRIVEGRYEKLRDPATGRDLPEDNWVWSPQGLIAMHYPEMWGFVEFTLAPPEEVARTGKACAFAAVERAQWVLRRVYYAQQAHRETHGRCAPTLEALGLASPPAAGDPWPPELRASRDRYELRLPDGAGWIWHLTEEGRVWRLADDGPAR